MIHKLMITLLLLAYFATLIMSTGHLAEWYALSLGKLPRELAWGLAGALEFTAFLLSLLSNSLLRQSRWAGGGALAALGLVWVGNALSMHRGAPELALWEVFLMSLFVPVGTYAVGKVVGELLTWPAGGRSGAPVATKMATGAQRVATQDTSAGHNERVVASAGVHMAAQGGHLYERMDEPAATPQEAKATLRYHERSLNMELTVEGKAAELVSALAAYGGPVAVTRLAADLGWPRTTVRRYLERLEDEGVVRRTEDGWTLNGDRDGH